MGLLNKSLREAIKGHMSDWPVNARECSKKHALSLPKCPQQGRSRFDARSVLSVRERERREERQVCEPEGGKAATMSVRSQRTPLACHP